MLQTRDGNGSAIPVWDLPVRLFHWLLFALIAFLWWTGETDRLEWHKLGGFAVAGLIVFRVYWGFFGSDTARFGHFLRGPRAVMRYLRGETVSAPGHNPLGGWSVAVLLAAVAVETGLGLFALDEDGVDAGPLANYLSVDQATQAGEWHEVVFNVLLVLIGIHIAAILFYLLRRKNLITPMITGRAQLASDEPAPRFAPALSFLIGSVLAAATFFILWWIDTH